MKNGNGKVEWKDRVVGFERRPAKGFQANPLNFRRHPNVQRDLPRVLRYIDGPCYMWFAGREGLEPFLSLSKQACEIHALIIWNKINATYAAMNAQYKQRHEPCLYFKPQGSTLRWCGPTDEATVWDVKRDAQNSHHPTQKPVELASRAIKNHTSRSVIDPFVGSGTTICAAEINNRRCFALEIKPEYCAVSLERLSAMGLQPKRIESGK